MHQIQDTVVHFTYNVSYDWLKFMSFSDPDQNATLEYSMEGSDLLTADKYTGRIKMTKDWRANVEAVFKSCVSGKYNS